MWLDTVGTGGGFCGCALQALELYEALGAHGFVATPCSIDVTGIVLLSSNGGQMDTNAKRVLELSQVPLQWLVWNTMRKEKEKSWRIFVVVVVPQVQAPPL